MKFDKYNRIARVYPTIITTLPLIILFSYITTIELKNLLQEILVLQILTGVSLSMVTIYVAMQINRFISKEFFEKFYFKNELDMPTTNFLLFTNSEFSKAYKLRLREQIKTDFGLEINIEKEEQNDLLETRKQIVGAVGLIRNKVKNGQLLLQHNIEYGFVRNLIGGSVVGFIASIFNLIYFHFFGKIEFLYNISIITTVCYLTIFFLSRFLINRFGQLYAKRLYQEYLTL